MISLAGAIARAALKCKDFLILPCTVYMPGKWVVARAASFSPSRSQIRSQIKTIRLRNTRIKINYIIRIVLKREIVFICHYVLVECKSCKSFYDEINLFYWSTNDLIKRHIFHEFIWVWVGLWWPGGLSTIRAAVRGVLPLGQRGRPRQLYQWQAGLHHRGDQ
jgi:hypothetical protein